MELRQLKYFLTLCEHKNYTSAAKELFIAQSTLSQQIIALENSINLQLIDRSSKSFRLTPVGDLFLEKLKKMYSHYKVFEEEIEMIKKSQTPVLKYASLPAVNERYALELFENFSRKYPETIISHSSTIFYNLISFVEEDIVDISMAIIYEKKDYEDLGIVRMNVNNDGLVLVVPKKSEYSSIKDFSSPLMNELLNKNCYLYDGWRDYEIPLNILKNYNPQLNKISYYNNLIMFLSSPYAWDGFTILPKHHLNNLQVGSLYHYIDFPDNACSLDLAFIYKKSNTNPALKSFLETLNSF